MPPSKDVNGTYALEDSERDEPSVAANKKSVWLQVNGLSGRADALEVAPAEGQLYSVWVHTFKEAENLVSNKMGGLPGYDGSWATTGWGNTDPGSGNRIFIGGGNRQMAYTNLKREQVIDLITHMRRESPGTVLQYRRNPN